MAWIYAFHLAFYLLFTLRRGGTKSPASPEAGTSSPPVSAPYARALLVLHMVAFAVFYYGIGRTVFVRGNPSLLFAPQRLLGGAVMVAAGALLVSALRVFESWRLLARIEEGHRLCRRGPFRLVRHPIYVSMDLLALGTVLWVPRPVVLAGAILIALAGDLRARTEERLLARVFGDEYRDYCRTTARAIPGLY
jgi:protein-S-isoprenylcysteine O-methyltransferase Ste14